MRRAGFLHVPLEHEIVASRSVWGGAAGGYGRGGRRGVTEAMVLRRGASAAAAGARSGIVGASRNERAADPLGMGVASAVTLVETLVDLGTKAGPALVVDGVCLPTEACRDRDQSLPDLSAVPATISASPRIISPDQGERLTSRPRHRPLGSLPTQLSPGFRDLESRHRAQSQNHSTYPSPYSPSRPARHAARTATARSSTATSEGPISTTGNSAPDTARFLAPAILRRRYGSCITCWGVKTFGGRAVGLSLRLSFLCGITLARAEGSVVAGEVGLEGEGRGGGRGVGRWRGSGGFGGDARTCLN